MTTLDGLTGQLIDDTPPPQLQIVTCHREMRPQWDSRCIVCRCHTDWTFEVMIPSSVHTLWRKGSGAEFVFEPCCGRVECLSAFDRVANEQWATYRASQSEWGFLAGMSF